MTHIYMFLLHFTFTVYILPHSMELATALPPTKFFVLLPLSCAVCPFLHAVYAACKLALVLLVLVSQTRTRRQS